MPKCRIADSSSSDNDSDSEKRTEQPNIISHDVENSKALSSTDSPIVTSTGTPDIKMREEQATHNSEDVREDSSSEDDAPLSGLGKLKTLGTKESEKADKDEPNESKAFDAENNVKGEETDQSRSSSDEDATEDTVKSVTSKKCVSEDSSSEDDAPLSGLGKLKTLGITESEKADKDGPKESKAVEVKNNVKDEETDPSRSSSGEDATEETMKSVTSKKCVRPNKKRHESNMKKADSSKLIRLKKYLSIAGIRVQSYEKAFEGCNTMKAKERKLLTLLEDNGLNGVPTIDKCKRLKNKRDQDNEVAELDLGNILPSPGGRKRRTRKSYTNNNENIKPPIMRQNNDNIVNNDWMDKLSDLVGSDSNDNIKQPPKKKMIIYDSDE